MEAPFTPSLPCPNIIEHSIQTQTQSADSDFLANPNPSFEHVGVDEEGLYIDVGPQTPIPPNPRSEADTKENSESDTYHESDSDDESLSDDEVEGIDDIVKDREPAQKPDADHDKMDPPMAVGTLYSDMDAWCIAVARIWDAGGDFMHLL
ncbi:hypothetical protein C2845_PM07G31170 [Panicum miliaceum]|uniref:Uncharacterized protein n=1 Tax=Panicum miliaceum TaxID=4540 RepID=A0A3L6SNQ5_PANMI|nr:hypothetical protein C2845_PM07G31170 [Panicum miliaceum]